MREKNVVLGTKYQTRVYKSVFYCYLFNNKYLFIYLYSNTRIFITHSVQGNAGTSLMESE